MPTPEEIRLQQENAKYTRQAAEANQQSAEASSSLIDDLKEALGIRQRYSQNEASVLKINKDINSAIDRQKAGLTSVKDATNQIKKNTELANKARATANSLTKGLDTAQAGLVKTIKDQRAALNQSNQEYEDLIQAAAAGQKIEEGRIEELQEAIALSEAEVAAGLEMLSIQGQLALLTEEQADQLDKVTAQRKEDLEILKKVEKSFGAFGSIAKALGELPVVGKAFSGAMSNAQNRVKELTDEAGGELPSALERAQIFAEEFSDNMLKATLAFVIQQALVLNKAFVETRRVLGLTRNEVSNINSELRDTEAASGNIYTTDQERLATLVQITKTLGFNAQILGKENVAGAARLEQSLGLAADAAGGLATFAALTGTNTMDAAREAFDLTRQFNLANKTAFSQQQILEKVGRTSKTIGAFFQFNTRELTKATLQAEKLGLSLDEVSGIASNLLQFESSITAELEAELFLGENINLERARQLALTNKLGELGEELADNEQIRSAFASNNRFAIEATAKALGMSVDQMSKAYYQQELLNLGAENFKSIYGGVALEQAESLAVQEKFQKSLARLAEAITPFVELMADLLSNTTAVYATLGAMAGFRIGSLIAPLLTAIPGIGPILGIVGALAGLILPNVALAEGGIVSKPTTALIGEGGEPEAVVPLSKAQDMGFVNNPSNQSADMGPVIAKLDELLSVVKAGGTITIDGQAVGKALTMASYSTGS